MICVGSEKKPWRFSWVWDHCHCISKYNVTLDWDSPKDKFLHHSYTKIVTFVVLLAD